MEIFLALFVLAQCALCGSILYALWPRPSAVPPPDAADTLPPSDFLPEMTAGTAKQLRAAINKEAIK